MNHTRKPSRGGLTTNTTEQLFEYLDRIEAKLDHALSQIDRVKREQRSIARTEIGMELKQMADFKELADEVTGIKGVVNSAKAVLDGLEAKVAELEAGMDDGPDKEKVAELAAELRATKNDLAEAIAAPGGSTGGVGGSTGGV